MDAGNSPSCPWVSRLLTRTCLNQKHFLTASQLFLSGALPLFLCAALLALGLHQGFSLTVRNFFLMSNLVDFNAARLAHKKLENPAKPV